MARGPKALGKKRGKVSPANIREIRDWALLLDDTLGDEVRMAQAEVFALVDGADSKAARRKIQAYVSGLEDTLSSSRQNLKKVWYRETEEKISREPLADDAYVFVPFEKKGARQVAALNLKNGRDVWLEEERCSLFYPVSVSDRSVFTLRGTQRSPAKLISYAKKSGNRIGSFGGKDMRSLGSFRKFGGSLDDTYLLGFDKGLAAFDWRLQRVWDVKVGGSNLELLWGEGNEAVFKSFDDIYRVDLAQGKLLWKAKSTRRLHFDSAVVIGNQVYVRETNCKEVGSLRALDIESGEEQWSFSEENVGFGRIAANGNVLKVDGFVVEDYITNCHIKYELCSKTGRKLRSCEKSVSERWLSSMRTVNGKEFTASGSYGEGFELSVSNTGEDSVLWKRKMDGKDYQVHNGHIFLKENDELLVLSSDDGREVALLPLDEARQECSVAGNSSDSFLLYGENLLERYDIV